MKETVKNKIKKWLLGIDRQETLPNDIVALNFNISEPYELELIGSSWYDDKDPDWACDDDFVPDDCFLPLDEIPEEVHWEQALSMITEILKEIVAENSIKLFNVQHIAVGRRFCRWRFSNRKITYTLSLARACSSCQITKLQPVRLAPN